MSKITINFQTLNMKAGIWLTVSQYKYYSIVSCTYAYSYAYYSTAH